MADFAVGLAIGIIATLFVVGMYATVVAGARADDKIESLLEIDALRGELATTKVAANEQRERADYYYDLYCVGAKANADLLNGRTR